MRQPHKKGGITMPDVIYTVSETAKLLKTNSNYVYSLIRLGYLPALKLGSMKVRKEAIDEFLKKYEGKDLTDLENIKELEGSKHIEEI